MLNIFDRYHQLTFDNLHDPKRYELQIQKLFDKTKTNYGIGGLFEKNFKGIPIFSFGYDRQSLAYALAEEVRKENYFLTPPEECRIHIQAKNKDRIVYKFHPADKIVIAVLSSLITELFSPFLSDYVFSYRAGVSNKDEVIVLGNYIKQMRKENGHRSFFIFQTDIASYSDVINVTDRCHFWPMLTSYFKKLNIEPTPYQWYLLKESIRPAYQSADGPLQCNLKGVPTGSPITQVIYNYYISDLDMEMEQQENLFYARYGDDIVLCSPDMEVVEQAKNQLLDGLNKRGLAASEKKTLQYYFSPAGNQGPNSGWRGSNRIDFLGYSLKATGEYAISVPRQKKLMLRVRKRIKNIIKMIPSETVDKKGRILSKFFNDYLSDITNQNNPLILAVRQTNDMQELKEMDRKIALAIAEAATGKKGVKVFREVPYKKIRQEWGLRSLVELRCRLYSHTYLADALGNGRSRGELL